MNLHPTESRSAEEPASRPGSAPFSTPETGASGLTHFDAHGRAHMVDIADKPATKRVAVACGQIWMSEATAQLIASGQASKGDVLGVARLAGIMAAKRTADLIPLCHPIPLSHVSVNFEVLSHATCHAGQPVFGFTCTAKAETVGATGVEMEALTAVQMALLTVYDMVKAVERGMVINGVKLLSKEGGRSGRYVHPDSTTSNHPL